MFVLTVSILLLAIPQSECIRRAKAVLYGDNSPISYGSLIFIQNSAADPVHITGTLSGLNISSAHVCLIKREIFVLNLIFRVFIYIQILYQMVHQIVPLLVVILILIASQIISKFKYNIFLLLQILYMVHVELI
jgi:hypothetical protein